MTEEKQKISFSFENLSKRILFGVIFLLPIFFLPTRIMSLAQAKMTVLGVGLVAAFIFFLIEKIRKSNLLYSTQLPYYAIFLLPVVYLVSSFTGINRHASLMGVGFESDTLHAIALFALFAFLSSVLLRGKKNIATALSLSVLSFACITVFHLVRLFFPGLTLGFLGSTASSLIGTWSDLAILSGLFMGIILLALEILSLSIVLDVICYIFLTVLFLFIALSNFGFNLYVISVPIFILLAALSVAVFAYSLSLKKLKKTSVPAKFSFLAPSVAVFIISILLVVFGGFINGKLSHTFNLYYAEGRPSWDTTFGIAGKVISQKYFFGSGPATFANEWNLFKPQQFSLTDFWNTDFTSGIGYIPTALVTTGPLGILAWLAFLAALFYLSYKIAFVSPSKDKLYTFLRTTSAFGAVYLAVVNILYVPNVYLIALLFLFAGLVFAISFDEGILKEKEIVFGKHHKKGFLFTFFVTLLIIASAFWLYNIVRKDAAVYYANKSLVIASESGDVDASRNAIVKAISLDAEPVYFGFLAQADVSKLAQIASASKDAGSTQATDIQNFLSDAVNASTAGENLDHASFRSLVSSGTILEAIGNLGITQAYDGAIAKYKASTDKNPYSPLPYFFMARTEVARKNTDAAKQYLLQAVTLKQNFSDAYLLASQVALAGGDSATSETLALEALQYNPSNFTLAYQLGIMKFNEKDYKNAALLFENALYGNPNYANAKYYLALSLYQTGDKVDALSLLNNLLASNPDSKELKDAISKIQANINPIATPAPKIVATSTPAKSKTPTPTTTTSTKKTSTTTPKTATK